MHIVRLKPGKEKSLQGNHPWIFSGALQKVDQVIESGALVRVETSENAFVSIGSYNHASSIRVRLFTRKEEVMNQAWFEKKFQELKTWKLQALQEQGMQTNAYRLAFAESDGLPGFIIDIYDTVAVFQAHTAGAEVLKPLVIAALQTVIKPSAIVERSDVKVRKQEGLETMPVGVVAGELPNPIISIQENGMTILVDVLKGQKTGFFLDQRANRAMAARYAKDKVCANIFSYTGAFGVAMRKGGATSVSNIDVSEKALEEAEAMYKANGIEAGENEFLIADGFVYLADQPENSVDLMVVDPPAFAKSVHQDAEALRAYTKLNAAAMRVLKNGGILITCSCSGSVSEADFSNAIRIAAKKQGITLRLLEKTAQPADHAVNPDFPEGNYLKCFALRVEKP